MVKLNHFETKLEGMANFYMALPLIVTDESDKIYADLAKDAAKRILEIIEEYRANPKNKHLKELHANLMTLTRGVERFHEEGISTRHREYGKLRAELYKFLESEIKW